MNRSYVIVLAALAIATAGSGAAQEPEKETPPAGGTPTTCRPRIPSSWRMAWVQR